MPIDYRDYPQNWKTEIRPAILLRAGQACEGSPRYPDCRAKNGQKHPVTGSMVVLTVAHLDHVTTHNEADNLRAWCQRCHLTYDANQHTKNARHTRRSQKINVRQLTLWGGSQ